MHILSTNPNERVFYYSEKPENKLYPYNESFYFRVVEFTNDYCIIQRIDFIDNEVNYKLIKFVKPFVKSINDAINFIEKFNQ